MIQDNFAILKGMLLKYRVGKLTVNFRNHDGDNDIELLDIWWNELKDDLKNFELIDNSKIKKGVQHVHVIINNKCKYCELPRNEIFFEEVIDADA